MNTCTIYNPLYCRSPWRAPCYSPPCSPCHSPGHSPRNSPYGPVSPPCSPFFVPCVPPCVASCAPCDCLLLSKEKDCLITQLKSHIFDLEQRAKDYDCLNVKYQSLQNDYNCLHEVNLKTECSHKFNDKAFNKRIADQIC